jgi:hypothetical protein
MAEILRAASISMPFPDDGLRAAQQNCGRDFRLGSKADIGEPIIDVRFVQFASLRVTIGL